jgi:hypothetical protein
MVRSAERIQIPTLDPKFLRDRNPGSNWWVTNFNENISLLNKLAGNLPRSLTWRQRTVEQLKAEVDQLRALGLPMDAYKLAWQDMLDQIQAFGLLSAWRLIELTSSAIWSIRRDDPLCAAIMARAALETTASYAWFQSKVRPGIDAVIGKDQFIDFEQLEIEILKTLWASRLEDVEAFYNPTNIVTIIGHITSKIPDQEDVGICYGTLCEVAHPNMLGRSLFLSEQDGVTVISRKRGPSAAVIEHSALLALSWAAGTLPHSLTAMQATCARMMKDVNRFAAKVASGRTAPASSE